jgi:heme exporter protein D
MGNYSIATWLAGAALLLFGLALIMAPLMRARRATPVHHAQRAQLLQARAATLAQLRALEDDHLAGKVATADYDLLRTQLMREGATVLRDLDALEENIKP